MSIDLEIKRLQKLQAKAAARVKKLTAKKEMVDQNLQNATAECMRWSEALSALSGESTKLQETLKSAIKEYAANPTDWILQNAHSGTPREIAEAVAKIPDSGNLPPPEPGTKWVQVGTEWVLVPETGSADTSNLPLAAIALPPIGDDEGFESPIQDVMP